MKGFVLLLAAFLTLSAGPAASSDEVASLVDAVVEAYGGATALERLRSYRVEAELEATAQAAAGRILKDYQQPQRLRVEIAYPTVREVRILDGEKGWRGDDHVLRRVDGFPRLAMLYQLVRSGIPECLVRRKTEVRDLGTKTKEGTEYRVLALAWSPELEVSFWVHPKSYRILWTEGILRVGESAAVFGTRYGNFQRVDGVLYPFLEETLVPGGQRTGRAKVTSLSFAPEDLGPFDPATPKAHRR